MIAIRLKRIWAAPLLLVMPLGSCAQPPPSGQVLASVGGEDITKRDLAEEMKASGFAASDAALRGQALQRLVDRTLLARAARHQRLDLTPEYLAAVRRARAQLLVSMLTNEAGIDSVGPSPAQVARFVAARPWSFADRHYLVLDQLTVTPRADDEARLAGFASIDEAAQALRTANRMARRSRTTIDTAKLPEATAKLLLADRRSPVVLASPDATRIVMVEDRRPAAIEGQQATKIGEAVLQRMNLDEAMAALIAKERKATPVRYQNGLGPAAR